MIFVRIGFFHGKNLASWSWGWLGAGWMKNHGFQWQAVRSSARTSVLELGLGRGASWCKHHLAGERPHSRWKHFYLGWVHIRNGGLRMVGDFAMMSIWIVAWFGCALVRHDSGMIFALFEHDLAWFQHHFGMSADSFVAKLVNLHLCELKQFKIPCYFVQFIYTKTIICLSF